VSAQPPPAGSARPASARDTAVSVVSAYGQFRVLLVVLALWSFFAGFALLTGQVGALSYDGGDKTAGRVVGAHMLILTPVYALLAWRREQYRLFVWIPYAAQLAIIVPGIWELLFGDRDLGDGVLLLLVAIIFFSLLVYVWWSSHPLGWFGGGDAEEETDDDAEAEEFFEDEEEPPPTDDERAQRARRYRRSF
jgi:hypothetical protein